MHQKPDNSQRILNDLQWLIKSPVIVNATFHQVFINSPVDFTGNYDSDLAKYIDQILPALACSESQRLGIYYEQLMQYLLTLLPEYDIITTNLQVTDESNTLGEFDLVYLKNNALIHREMAVKFYLGLPTATGVTTTSHWVGPNSNDRLDKKLDKFMKQIELSQTPQGRRALKQQGIEGALISAINTEALLQGYLFYPWRQRCFAPANINPNHLREHWLPLNSLSAFLSEHNFSLVYFILPRQQWLSPFIEPCGHTTHATATVLSHQLRQHFNKSNSAVLVSACEIVNNIYQEKLRFFVVSDSWLNKVRDGQ